MTVIQHKVASNQPITLTLGELASRTQSVLQGSADLKIQGVGTISGAKPGQISFLTSIKYRNFLPTTNASAVVLTAAEAKLCTVGALICADPKYVFAQVVQYLYPNLTIQAEHHASAVIDSTCDIHPLTFIGPNCVIGKGVKIGENVVIEAGCYIGDGCEIGSGTVLYPRATLYHGVKIGQDCILHSGVVIGSDGFGFANHQGRWLKVGQIGGVKIGDRVEIGANTTIDRGAIEDTEIGNDVILDNLIQIGHNVKIGDGSAIAACCGIAGSAVIGKYCMIGGGCKIVGHITITDKVNLVGSTNVGQSITQAGTYASGLTANDMRTWKKNLVRFHQLDNLALRLFDVERKLKEESRSGNG